MDVLLLEETLAVVRVLEQGWGNRIDFTDVLLLLLFFYSVCYMMGADFNPFIYFRF